MKIRLRSDGRYQISLYLGKTADGKEIRRVVYGKTQKEAQAKADALKIKYCKGIDPAAERESFAVWTDRWLSIKKAEVSLAQFRLCAARAAVFTERLGRIRLSDISIADLQTVINDLAFENPRTGKPTAKNTLKSYKQVASQIFAFAIQARAVDYNPAEYIRLPQNAPCKARTAVSHDIILLIDKTPHRAKTAAYLMLYAGLRRGEVAALTWSDIDFAHKAIAINKAVTYKTDKPEIKSPKTEAGRRVIPMPDNLADYLSSLPRTSTLVVTSASGRQMTEQAWKRLWESYLNTLNETAYNEIMPSRSKYHPS